MGYVQNEDADAAGDEGVIRFRIEVYMVTWIKVSLTAMCICTVLSISTSCSNEDPNMGEEFSLGIGETASIKGEQLRIQFLEISEDSRCPRNVTRIWEGRAIAVVTVFQEDTSEQITLVEQGLIDTQEKEQFKEYTLVYKILPYPEKAEEPIPFDEYRLILTVYKD